MTERYEIRAVRNRSDRGAFARVVLQVAPEHALTVEEIEYDERLGKGGEKFVAWRAAEPVACGGTGRIHHYAPGFDAWWGDLAVLETHRGRGLGSALYAQISLAASAAGKRALHVLVTEASPEGLAWLERRGFREWERTRRVELDLSNVPPVSPAVAGIEIVTLAQRPELMPAVHAVALEAFADIPGSDEAHFAGSYEDWVARSVTAPGIPRDGFFVALVDGEVAGYASLEIPGAHPRIAWHDMTAVARAQRGRGVATSLKRATITWAKEAGLDRLQTENNIDNAAMRAVNASLGYQPMPDEVTLRGPLAPP